MPLTYDELVLCVQQAQSSSAALERRQGAIFEYTCATLAVDPHGPDGDRVFDVIYNQVPVSTISDILEKIGVNLDEDPAAVAARQAIPENPDF